MTEIGQSSDEYGMTFFAPDSREEFDVQCTDRLSEVFRCLHGKEVLKGTCIGVTTVQRFVNHHGDCAWAKVRAAKRATFSTSRFLGARNMSHVQS
jgi:light-regulated signal transduction histidine kinase (bacteriophytochrome)